MAAVGNNSFWKKNAKSVPGSIKPVYGAQHPPLQEKPTSEQLTPKKQNKMRPKNSFQDFKELTDDAWDDTEDNLLEMARVKISLHDAQSTALQVIKNHSQQQQALTQAKVRHSCSAQIETTGEPDSKIRTNSTDEQSPNVVTPINSSTSAPNTPSHAPGLRHGGPGLGVRQNSRTQFKTSPYSRVASHDRETGKIDKFKSLLESPNVNFDALRKLSWAGVPMQYRADTWRLLCGYLPLILDRRESLLDRKRQDYHNFVEQYYSTRHQDIHLETYRQIHIDIPRMSPLIPLFQQQLVQEIFERILYIWAIRHPASGYVQGMNDLVTPFFIVFLTEYIKQDVDIENYQLSQLPDTSLQNLEADCFWCFSKLLDGIQDNYTFAQPGIQKRVNSLKDLISRIDNSLHRHLDQQHVEYLQFAFRWMNNLLMREMSLHCVIRLWDAYLSEPDGFASFHLYVCAALLTKFSQELLREKDFQGLMMLLQNLPTQDWSHEDVDLLLADAYRLKFTFADAPKHLNDSTS